MPQYQIADRSESILEALLKFFQNQANLKQFLDVVIFKTRNLPLRLLDWFCTNYAKKNDVCYNIRRPNGTVEVFRVYRSYKAQLKGNKKKLFDPFCRDDIISLECESPTDNLPMEFETAMCQLRFFKWAIENLLLDYVETHRDKIYTDMAENSSKSIDDTTDDKPKNSRRKKTELSKSIYQQIHVSKQSTTMTFNSTPSIGSIIA